MKITHGPIAKNFDEKLRNLQTAYESDTSNEAGTIRWLLDNLVRERRALWQIAGNADLPPATRAAAERGLQEVPEAD